MRISDWSSDVCSSDLYFPDVSIGIREAAAEHEAMILHRVGVGDAAVRTGRVGKTVDLFLALAAYREHDFTAVAGRNGACGESFPLVVRQQHYADRVGQYHAGCRLVRERSEEHTSELQSLMRISY